MELIRSNILNYTPFNKEKREIDFGPKRTYDEIVEFNENVSKNIDALISIKLYTKEKKEFLDRLNKIKEIGSVETKEEQKEFIKILNEVNLLDNHYHIYTKYVVPNKLNEITNKFNEIEDKLAIYEYKPGGIKYFEVKAHFEELAKKYS